VDQWPFTSQSITGVGIRSDSTSSCSTAVSITYLGYSRCGGHSDPHCIAIRRRRLKHPRLAGPLFLPGEGAEIRSPSILLVVSRVLMVSGRGPERSTHARTGARRAE